MDKRTLLEFDALACFDGPDQSVGARREAPCRCLSQASAAGSGEGLGGDSLRKAWHEEDRKSYNPIPCFFFLWSCLVQPASRQ